VGTASYLFLLVCREARHELTAMASLRGSARQRRWWTGVRARPRLERHAGTHKESGKPEHKDLG